MPNDMDSAYNAWTGRKATALRRPKLDCGHPKADDVHFHLWCDRLTCSPECAEAPHDCGEFKGKSESGIEEEAVEPEAVVDAPYVCLHGTVGGCDDPWAPPATIAMPADQFDALMATIDGPDDMPALRAIHERRHPTLAEMNAASAAVRARREQAPQPIRHGFSTTHWGGITGWRTICCCQQGFGEEYWHTHAHEHGVDPHGRHRDGAPCPCLTRCEQAAPSADAALEPALDEQIPVAPWWRRMLGGGTR